MDTVDIQAVESKLSDVTVTAIPLTPSKSLPSPAASTSSTASLTVSGGNSANNNSNNNNNNSQLPQQQPGQSKYAQLLGVIEEMGREVRPTYAGSRSSAERLKRGIVHARILVRECLLETERSARQ